MKLDGVGEVMAIRRLQFLGEPGREVPVKLGRPKPSVDSPESGEYFCPFQITGVGNERVRYAAGVDGVHALELALKLIGSELDRLNSEAGGRLRWEFDESGGFGFPQDFLKADS